ncbi:MAG: TIGR04282 family arsenosugar biosynthesis glycosyltransferase [Thiotrichales bacterium]|nr:TIGR04282 family arsenosugar biosynthesis glycosyltransferase [Thiotrichales bacterium]
MPADRCLIIFTRKPEPGRVKKRLIAALGEHASADLYQQMVETTLDMAGTLGKTDVHVCISGDSDHRFAHRIEQVYGYACHAQSGRDLGERMARAISTGLEIYRQLVLIGCDCPGLNAEIIDTAFSHLAHGCTTVLGPANDGGYYLIGFSQSEPEHSPASGNGKTGDGDRPYARPVTELLHKVFEAVPWGTSSVAEITRTRLQSLGASWEELPVLTDIDRPEDLEHYMEHLPCSIRSLHPSS